MSTAEQETPAATPATENAEVVVFRKYDKDIAELKASVEGLVVESKEGFPKAKEAKQVCVKLRSRLEEIRVELKAPLLERGRIIDKEAKRIEALILAIETPLGTKIKAIEDEKARLKREKEEAERKKIEDEQRAKLEAEAAAEKARRDAEEKAAREKAEAERKVKEEREAAERRELELKLAAEKAERERWQAIGRAEREKQTAIEAERRKQEEAERARLAEEARVRAEAERRAADLANRERVHVEIRDMLMSEGLPQTYAAAVVSLLSEGRVPHCVVRY